MINIKTIFYSLIIISSFATLSSAQVLVNKESPTLDPANQELLDALEKSMLQSQQENSGLLLDKIKESIGDKNWNGIKQKQAPKSNSSLTIIVPSNDTTTKQINNLPPQTNNIQQINSSPQTNNPQQINNSPNTIIPQIDPNQNINLEQSTRIISEPNPVSTIDAIDQIQKTLIFSEKKRSSKNITQKKPSTNINHTSKSKSKVEFLVSKPSSRGNARTKQKQQIAYNASLAGQYEVAIEIYKQILKSDPNNNYVSFSLAACYHKLGQYKQAKNLYYKLLKKEWADQKTKEQLISNFLEVIVEESPNDAIYLLGKLIDQNPDSAYIMAGSAMAYDRINRPDQAILLLKRAIHLNPHQETYKFNLAVIFDKKGDYQNALPKYQSLIKKYISSGELDESIPIEQVKQRVDFIINRRDYAK
ncbi:MAG: tetratricopeptide (TPR) repeat protein [Rickettsiales bacterium]|jgi:tetratricopeptide (TPR) repeat protein